MINLQKTLNFSKNLSLKVGRIFLEGQKTVRIENYKDKVDIVTNIDLLAEKTIIKAIEKQYPDHDISSEEKGFIDKKSDYTWYIDPLDGTKEYLRQIPEYNSSFCLFYKKRPVSAVVNIPYSNQLFSGAKGVGAFLNKKKIKVNRMKDLKRSIVYSHPPAVEKVSRRYLKKVCQTTEMLIQNVYRLRFSPNSNIYLSFLALGSIEAYLGFARPINAVHDVVPGFFIAQMAGAKITDLDGKPLDFSKAGQFYLASNGKIHNQLLKIINQF